MQAPKRHMTYLVSHLGSSVLLLLLLLFSGQKRLVKNLVISNWKWVCNMYGSMGLDPLLWDPPVTAPHWRDKSAIQKILPTGGLSMDWRKTGVADCQLQSNKALENFSSQIAPSCHHCRSLLMCPSSFEECTEERRLAKSRKSNKEVQMFCIPQHHYLWSVHSLWWSLNNHGKLSQELKPC